MLAESERQQAIKQFGTKSQCLLRLIDSRASTPVITNAMLAKDNGRIKGKLDLMTKPMLAKSKRQLRKHQIFVRKPTRHRTLEPQVKAHFSPSRAVVSCDLQGAICKKEARFYTQFQDGTMTHNGICFKRFFIAPLNR